ncbi:hypothetical protein ACIP9H_01200 [Streptomyces sp. NPDC088732]|uniref:hypothetical protein n=1 Tax=Streptomyces sp. NPDC088732 TaxID=3365879 RepID=UPI00381D4FCA
MPENGTPRQTRLRLARQRPGPSRVRARERAEELDLEAARPGRRLSLLTLGAVVTIVATLGSLVTTGIGTLWSARVAEDQLLQSREQDEDRRKADDDAAREQASRIAFWIRRSSDGETLHLMNRSPDPVTDVHVTFGVWARKEPREANYRLLLSNLPPCSDTLIQSASLGYAIDLTPNMLTWALPLNPKRGKTPYRPFVDDVWFLGNRIGMDFTDRAGIRWTRTTEQPLNPGALEPPALLKVAGRVMGEPPVQPVTSCGGESKQ